MKIRYFLCLNCRRKRRFTVAYLKGGGYKRITCSRGHQHDIAISRYEKTELLLKSVYAAKIMDQYY